MIMKRKIMLYLLLVATLEIMSLVSVTRSRPYHAHAVFPDHQDQIPNFQEAASGSKSQRVVEVQKKVGAKDQETYRALGRLGSRPPSCNHKCLGCVPCEAIQIPATSDKLGLQYSNYEPEGWKCKCGTSFFNP